MNSTIEYNRYKVRYIDKWTNGKINETEMWGYHTEEDVIKHFGLNEPEVSWYEITKIDSDEKHT